MKDGAFEEVKKRLELLERGEELPKHESGPNVKREDNLDKILQELRKMNQKQNTMKKIMKFWFVLTIISLIVYAGFSIYIGINFIKAIK